ncbi:hypothetical protein PMIN03_004286 [Paraphaeosphaeria minitans]
MSSSPLRGRHRHLLSHPVSSTIIKEIRGYASKARFRRRQSNIVSREQVGTQTDQSNSLSEREEKERKKAKGVIRSNEAKVRQKTHHACMQCPIHPSKHHAHHPFSAPDSKKVCKR